MNKSAFAGTLMPPRPSTILRPGIPALAPGVERYRVKGRGTTVVKVMAGDRISIKDIEGGQLCEVSFVDAGGRFNAAGFGVGFSRAALGLQEILARDEEDFLMFFPVAGLSRPHSSQAVFLNPAIPCLHYITSRNVFGVWITRGQD
jgi:hypothetical protein